MNSPVVATADLIRTMPREVRVALAGALQNDPRFAELSAAERESFAQFKKLAEYTGSKVSEHTDVPPDSVLLPALDALWQWQQRKAATCLHVPDWEHPQPIYAAAWKPGLIVCARCTHLLRLRPGSTADRRCDLCGSVVDWLYSNTLNLGVLSYFFGACEHCR